MVWILPPINQVLVVALLSRFGCTYRTDLFDPETDLAVVNNIGYVSISEVASIPGIFGPKMT
jgi:hypothetical protein